MRQPSAPTAGRRVDLHAHTIFSDGLLTPEALVQRAIDRHVAALAITDHDSVEGLAPAFAAAGSALELVPGIEISTTREGQDLHILGYFIDPDHGPLRQRLAGFREERVARARRIVDRLSELGMELDPDAILEQAGPGVVGRPHVAAALLREGHVESLDDAFRRFLGARGEAYVPRPSVHPAEAIVLIHAAGGVSVLAHPGAALADAVVESLVDSGLRGIEVWHPQHGPASVRRWRAFARQHGLLETGGTDFHAPERGFDLGDLPVPAGVLGPLKEAAGVPG
jgi:predicted metal-dependent phosphoesterase TrpH